MLRRAGHSRMEVAHPAWTVPAMCAGYTSYDYLVVQDGRPNMRTSSWHVVVCICYRTGRLFVLVSGHWQSTPACLFLLLSKLMFLLIRLLLRQDPASAWCNVKHCSTLRCRAHPALLCSVGMLASVYVSIYVNMYEPMQQLHKHYKNRHRCHVIAYAQATQQLM